MNWKLAYLAGIIDGEGHFHYPLTVNGRGEKKYYPRMIVVNTDKNLIDWIKNNFEGSTSVQKYKDIHRKDCYRWALQGKKAVELAKQLQPYLIVKQEQVKVLFSSPTSE